MKKPLLTSTMLAIVASLSVTGQVAAHHPLSVINPEQFEMVDDMMGDNSNHNEVLGDVEDYEFMGNVNSGMDSIGAISTEPGGSMDANQDSAGGGLGGDRSAVGDSAGPGNSQSRR